MSIEFTRGVFITFEATTIIHLGRLERNISKGDLVEFDGISLKIGGEEVSMPELKAGIKRGWLRKPEPSSQLPAEPEKKTRIELEVEHIYDEETKVGSIDQALEKVVKEEPKNKYPVQVSSADDDTMTISGIHNTSGASVGGASSASDGLGLGEAQDAKSVPLQMKTATQQKTVLSDASSIAQQISALETMETSFSADVLEYKTDEQAEEVSEESIDILNAVDSGDVSPTGTVEVGGKNDKIVTLPSGVEWDKSLHWTKKVKIAVETYGSNPQILDEIKSVESETIGKNIDKSLASQGN